MVGAFPPERCGEGNYAFMYVSSLLRQVHNVKVSVISHKVKGAPPLDGLSEEERTRVEITKTYSTGSFLGRNLSFIWLFRAIARSRPHLMHLTYGPNTDFGGRIGEPLILLFLLLRLARIPVVVTLHSTWLPANVYARGRELGHGHMLSLLSAVYFRLFTKAFTRLASRVQILTTSENSEIARAYQSVYGLPASKLGEEPHGCRFCPITEGQMSKAKRDLGLLGRDFVFSFGFIRRDKGFEDLLRAVSGLSSSVRARLIVVIAGNTTTVSDFEYFKSLKHMLSELAIEDVVTIDRRYVPDEEIWKYIEAADIVVFPYLRSVGASGPLHHVICRGKPIIAADTGFFSIMEGTIPLYTPGNHGKLAMLLESLLTSRNEYDAAVSLAETYALMHDWSRVVRLNIELYATILDDRTANRTHTS